MISKAAAPALLVINNLHTESFDMQQTSELFKAKPKSVFEVLSDSNQVGFYMPAYQRAYAWQEHNIYDFFRDFRDMFENMLEKDAAIVFLGTLLTVDDSQCSTVYPLEKNSKPKQVKLVIDGQQR
ncbi:MAG: GmrSD restriction endonuclease domain-containing protein, partial [Aeromonas sp.]